MEVKSVNWKMRDAPVIQRKLVGKFRGLYLVFARLTGRKEMVGGG